MSRNKWDWLGEGIYFWEHGPQRARRWAEDKAARTSGQPAVIGAVIQLDRVLDLTDLRYTPLLRMAYAELVADFEARGLEMPQNAGLGAERKRRELDCQVINRLAALPGAANWGWQRKPASSIIDPQTPTGERMTKMPSTYDESSDMIAQTRKALEAWDKVPPAERFAWWVRFGLIDEQGRLRHDNVEEVPIGKLNDGRPVWQAKGNGQGG